METDINLQLKKLRSPRKRSNKRVETVSMLLEKNGWNPFERVDPKILEMLHRKHEKDAEKTRRYFLLTEPGKAGFPETEDAPI